MINTIKNTLNKIGVFMSENNMWFSLGKYLIISLLLATLAIMIDTKYIPVLKYIPEIFLASIGLAKLILGTLTGSLLTITTFTFSTIMVVISMYSSNFSPRVVNNFLTDKITMKVLGVFVGGFFYCITVLFFMKDNFSSYKVISATIAVLYSILCIIYFLIFVYNVSSSIQPTKLISNLYDESWDIIDKTLEERKNHTSLDQYDIGEYLSEVEILSNKSGYLVLIEFSEILKTLKNIKTNFVIKVEIGDFIVKNQAIATLYYNDDIGDSSLVQEITDKFSIEEERVAFSDYRYSLQKIIDITLRALSPGINDPNTAIHCINILGVILGNISVIKGKYTMIEDDNSLSKIIHADFNFRKDLYYSFYQIVHYGKSDISVILAILNALKTINHSATEEKEVAIKEFADYVYQNSIDNFTHEFDRDMLEHGLEPI